MRSVHHSRALAVTSVLLAGLCGWPTRADADPKTGVSAPRPKLHRHVPTVVNARPIVSRVNVPLSRPRRLLLEANDDLLIADWGAGAILRVTPDGKFSLVADGLNEPADLIRDSMGNLFVANHAQGMTGAGTIVKISDMGRQTIFAEGLTGPTSLLFGPEGNLYVANYGDNTIVRIGMDGRPAVLAENVPTPSAMVFDHAGQLIVASSLEGTLYRVSPETGAVVLLARGFLLPSDIAVDARGHVVVANLGGSTLSYVDTKGEVRTYALVPKGTISLLFDPDQNLLLANWDYQYVLKVISHLSIPCPHCGKKIPVRLRPQRIRKPMPAPMDEML